MNSIEQIKQYPEGAWTHAGAPLETAEKIKTTAQAVYYGVLTEEDCERLGAVAVRASFLAETRGDRLNPWLTAKSLAEHAKGGAFLNLAALDEMSDDHFYQAVAEIRLAEVNARAAESEL